MNETYRLQGDLNQLEYETDLLWTLGCQGLVQEGDEVVAYFAERIDIPLDGEWRTVEHEDYIARYYAELKAIHLKTLVIAPTHSSVTVTAGQQVVWLDPGMAFGSGHHETTRMALEALESCALMGKHVLDVGAGSGILTIAADKLGAARAYGIDIDPETVPVAEANALLNHSAAQFAVAEVDAEAPESADVLVANLFAELHAQLLAAYVRVLKPAGELFITGIMTSKLELVLAAIPAGLALIKTVHAGEWTLLHLRKARS